MLQRPLDQDDAHDVVIVGGGVAGFTTARRAQHAGLSVLVLDKRTDGPGANTRISGGRIHAAYMDPHRPADDLFEAIMDKTDGHARRDVARAWAKNAGRAIDFLASEGAVFRRGDREFLWHELQPRNPPKRETLFSPDEWKGRGPDLLLAKMRKACIADGGTYRPASRAVELDMAGTEARGVWFETSTGERRLARGRTVVLADGGFQANAELVHRHITSAYKLVGAATDTGDCLTMALAVGAVAANMEAFYGHTVIRDGGDPRPRVYPMPTQLINAAIVLDGHAQRIADESLGPEEYAMIDDPLAVHVARSRTPGNCWVIFDDAVWTGVASQTFWNAAFPLNPTLLEENGPFFSAPTLVELAGAIGLPAAQLSATVDEFNAFCTTGAALDPPRARSAEPIGTAPFHAVPLITGIMFAMGGILVDGHARVLDRDDRPFAGLYAVGGAMAGLQGGPRNGYSGGWSEAVTFGVLAAEHAAGRLAEQRPSAAAVRSDQKE